VTLNDLECRNGRYFALFTESDSFGANYVTVVEVKPIREVLVYSTFDRKKTNYTALRRDLDVRFPVCSSFRNQSSIKATLIIFNSP